MVFRKVEIPQEHLKHFSQMPVVMYQGGRHREKPYIIPTIRNPESETLEVPHGRRQRSNVTESGEQDAPRRNALILPPIKYPDGEGIIEIARTEMEMSFEWICIRSCQHDNLRCS